ncbi:MAG: hypothetical protein IJ561_00785 [Ruminococcus sp.]|nr:hypothetical protein [Ruminococcus sp.]
MKKVSDLLSVLIFFIMIAVFSVSMLVFSDKSPKFESSNDIYGQSERQIKESFPLLSSWRSMYSSILADVGQRMIGNIYISDDGLIRIISRIDEDKTKRITDSVNSLVERHKDVNFYALIVPTASGIYSEQLPMVINALDQQKFIDDLYFDLDSSVHSLDAFTPLFSSRDDYVYFRTDSCWTEYGAYMVYSKVIKKLGFSPIRLSAYDLEYAQRSYYGDLYKETYYQGVQPDLINIFKNKNGSFVTEVKSVTDGEEFSSASLYYSPALGTDKQLDIFLGGNSFEKCTITTSNTEAPRLLIIKGDYANMFVPFLTPHYSEITLVDPEKLDNQAIEETVDIDSYDQVLILFDVGQLAE